MPQVELEIGALPVHVRTARLIAAALARRLELDPVVIDEIKLAIGEACSRAVGVNVAAGADDPVIVRLRDDDEILEISVLDCGVAVAPGATESAAAALRSASEADDPGLAGTFDDPAELGALDHRLGLALIAGLVDDFSVVPRGPQTGTTVTMRWPIVTF